MKRIRINNDFTFAWAIERNGLPEDLSTAINMVLLARNSAGTLQTITDYEVAANMVSVEITPEIANVLGRYNFILTYELPDASLDDMERLCEVDTDAFIIVPRTAEADDSTDLLVTSDMAIGFKGDKGNGIQSITLTSTVGKVKTYTITFTDLTTTTFTVTDGADGHTPVITFVGTTIYVDGAAGVDLKGEQGDTGLQGEQGDTGLHGEQGIQGEQGDTGNGIQSITLLSTVGLVKTYRVTYTDNTTYDYTVTDGASTPIVQTIGASTTDVMSQKAVTDELALKEASTNKQNSLATDGTGTKFPTVDAVKSRADEIESLIIRKLVEPLGATYNTTTKLFSLNGLTDITEAQMINIYNHFSPLANSRNWIEAFAWAPIRTNSKITYAGGGTASNENRAFISCSTLEVFKGNKVVYDVTNMFYGCTSLREVDYLIFVNITAMMGSDTFTNCAALVTCNLKGVKANLSFAWSPLLSLASLQYLIQYRANGTTPITITVHPTVFAKLTDNTNYPTWYAVNQDALTNYITFASA